MAVGEETVTRLPPADEEKVPARPSVEIHNCSIVLSYVHKRRLVLAVSPCAHNRWLLLAVSPGALSCNGLTDTVKLP